MITVTNNESTPINSVESSIMLIYTIRLSPIIQNFTWTVIIELIGPQGVHIEIPNEHPELKHCSMVTDIPLSLQCGASTYPSQTIAATVNYFKTGIYNCIVTIMSGDPYINNIMRSNGTRFPTG